MRNNKISMFWNWLRWQCLNKKDENCSEIPKGTMIDDSQYITEVMKLIIIMRL